MTDSRPVSQLALVIAADWLVYLLAPKHPRL